MNQDGENGNQQFDVAIIGSGVSGLMSAAILSKAGYSVCVLEMESRIGGYLAGFRRKDFRFDTAIHWLNQTGPEGMVTKMFEFLGSDYPQTVPQKRIRRFKGESFDYLLTNHPDDLKKEWIQKYPHEKKGIEKFFKAARKIAHSFDNYSNMFRSEETMTVLEKGRHKLQLLKFATPFLRYIGYTGEAGLKKGLNRFFKEPELHAIFCSEPDLLSVLVPIAWAYIGDFQSPPKGGSQVIPEWLHHIIEHFDGTVLTRAKVQDIILEDDRCKGLRVVHKKKPLEIRSDYVIACCDVETLYEKMLPTHSVPELKKKKLKDAKLYSSSVTISLALDCTAEELGFNEELIFLSRDDISREEQSNGSPETSGISILAPTFRDKSLAPEGMGTLTLYVPAFMHQDNFWHTEKDEEGNIVRGEAYKKFKSDYADTIIDRVESTLAPGLREHITYIDVATPVTHWRYTGNRDGTMMGARTGRENMQAKIAHYQTPVEGLVLGGHWAELGGGVPIAVKSAANASLLVLRKKNPKAFRLLADYMDGKISLKRILSSEAFKDYDNSWVAKPTPADSKKTLQTAPKANI
ncbi:NAD(P)/FAD-dependent oxidoreductase [bacterium SCSIO 12741]|nr:NAD(P)/FAD-dependent oxidoreductase [bacterium SCSIO 12741]